MVNKSGKLVEGSSRVRHFDFRSKGPENVFGTIF